MANLKCLALIPARGGSKSIPKKNIVKLGGHPLIAYSIAVAKQSKYINRIIVTTDDRKMSSIAKKYGAEVPFLRPKKISQDMSLDIDFFRHALSWLKKHGDYCPDLIVHLRPTTPLREYKIVDKAILDIAKDKKATSLRSIEVLEIESPYKLFKKRGEYLGFFGKEDFRKDEEYYNYPRQRFPATYKANGYVDIVRPKVLLRTGLLHGRYIRAFVTKKQADIDNLDGLRAAEKLFTNNEYRSLIAKLEVLQKRS